MPLLPSIYEDQVIQTPGHSDTMPLNPFCHQGRLYQEPSIRSLHYYRMSAADMLRYQYHHDEDQLSLSSSSHSSSASSSASNYKSRKPSYRRLLREIRRLRSENASLHHSVNLLRSDLRHEQEGRQIAEACHRKYYEDSINTHTQLELEILDQQDRLVQLQQQLQDTSPFGMSMRARNALDNDDDDTLTPVDMNADLVHHSPPIVCDDEDENDENDEIDTLDDGSCLAAALDPALASAATSTSTNSDAQTAIKAHFTELARSYIRQALVSNLTSARTNLELDDLLLKYDPSPDVVLRTLSTAFLEWVEEAAGKQPLQASFPTIQDTFLHFWKTVLEHHVHSDDDEFVFLQAIELFLQQHPIPALVPEFHRILIMLYKYDIVDDDAVSHWWHSNANSPSTSSASSVHGDEDDEIEKDISLQLRKVTQKFVEWVDANNDSDDDDDDDDLDDIDHDALSEDDDAYDSVDFAEDEPESDAEIDVDNERLHCPLIDRALDTASPTASMQKPDAPKKKKSVTIVDA
ncbi:hypothetical protein BC940DRAFT_306826 [Gongronella butleri]|nr:hypothetical protein BC940DRAFT_306826 [Gongronella butleri]